MKITRQQAKIASMLLNQYDFKDLYNKYSVSRNFSKLRSIVDETDIECLLFELQNALKDEKGGVIEDDKQKCILSPEGRVIVVRARSSYLKEEVEFEPFAFRNNEESQQFALQAIGLDLAFLISQEIMDFFEKKEDIQQEVKEQIA